jgi:hypothetical protein
MSFGWTDGLTANSNTILAFSESAEIKNLFSAHMHKIGKFKFKFYR